jgi:hypothetical protein
MQCHADHALSFVIAYVTPAFSRSFSQLDISSSVDQQLSKSNTYCTWSLAMLFIDPKVILTLLTIRK